MMMDPMMTPQTMIKESLIMRNLASMMQKAKEVQTQLADLKQELADQRFHVTAGGGAVNVEADGKGNILSLKLSPDIIGLSSEDDVAMLEDLILVAVNQVRAEAEVAKAEKMKAITGGLPLPPGLDLPL